MNRKHAQQSDKDKERHLDSYRIKGRLTRTRRNQSERSSRSGGARGTETKGVK